MKYNPKVNEDMARLPGHAGIHPLTPDEFVQGALELMYEVAEALKAIAGMDAITLQPPAGASGEMTGILLARAYHTARGNPRKVVLVPDSAHGTNPATAARADYAVRSLKSDARGQIDLAALRAALKEDVAALMLTNPSTLGRFETDVTEIAKIVHDAGALLYMDGANMNALLGRARPGDFGVDMMHFNLHKTFSTPHGGGGPGAGPVAVTAALAPYLPVPTLERDGERYRRVWDRPDSIGKVHGFDGNYGVLVRAYTYIRINGREGLARVAEGAVLNNRYLSARMADTYPLPFGPGMHESVFSGTFLREHGVKTLDVAKRLLDFGFHAPTIYFPLIVPEALMIEPTETATKDELDRFADVMLAIADEARRTPDVVTGAPHTTPVGRLDESKAARQPNLKYEWPTD
jgi:glycine dehydrogenase subunit 2